MTEVQADIGVHIDTSDSLSQLKALQRQLSLFHTSIARSSSEAAIAQRGMQTNLLNSINAISGVTAELRTVKTTSEAFTTSLEKNGFSMKEYFRYAGASTKTFGKIFKSEFDTIGKVAESRVRALQTQYIKLGRDTSGAMKAIAVMPDNLDLKNRTTQLQLAAQKQALFNQLLKQGSTNLLNFGKNTQWAGRQLMVGFTVPLMMAGGAASKVFMDMESAAIKFKKVYGDLMTSPQETADALAGIKELANGFTQYGVAASKTVALAASAAAAGFKGVALQRQTTEATRLSVLGQIDSQQALDTTISLNNAFRVSSQDLAETIDFLNAVENQTVLSLDDITLAIPKAAPVIRGLGGDVKDLAFFLTAMKEGGVNASEGANALKSGLGKLIAPTKSATTMLTSMGIDLNGIVKRNVGNVKATVLEFGEALNGLSNQDRQKALVKTFGIMQYARLGAMFNNVTKEGTQASRVLDLMGASVEDLANLSSKELGITSQSPMVQFQKSVEDLKVAIVPIGKIFLESVTPVLKSVAGLLDRFNGMSDGVKKVITIITIAIAGLGPVVLMAFGLLANGVANIMKLFGMLRNGYLRLTGQSRVLGEQTQYLTMEQLDAAAASHSLNKAHANLTQQFTLEAGAVKQLTAAYQAATIAAQKFAVSNPGMMAARGMPKKYADGVSLVPGSGNGDTVPAMLTPGEAVIPKKMTQKYGGLIRGMISDNISGFAKGGVVGGHFLGMPLGFKKVTDRRDSQSLMETISSAVSSSRFGSMVPTNFGTQIAATTGHSFPVAGVGGVYQKADGTKVFVKPMMDDVAALAEERATTIARDVHGLRSPKQTIHTMVDPTGGMGQRKLIVLVSPYDESFANPSGKFTKGDYFKQLVAANLRGDKDLQMANLSGSMLADVGTAGVFKMASGQRSFADSMPSMAEQAGINLLGVKGGAKRFFAEATLDVPRSMTAEAYHMAMMKEIETTLPKLRKTVSTFKLNDAESRVYRDMITRLEEGSKVDWRGYHAIHSSVVPAPGKPKTAAQILKKQEEEALRIRQSGHANKDRLYRYAGGTNSVPGSGNGDTVPAMLTPGEAVIPAKMSKKYAPLVRGMIADNIPGFNGGRLGSSSNSKGINAFTNATIKLPSTLNRQLSNGAPSGEIASAISGSGPAIMSGIVYEIATQLGATSPKEVARMMKNNPKLIKFAQDTHAGLVQNFGDMSGTIKDKEFGDVATRVMKENAAKHGFDKEFASILSTQTMISDASRGGGRSADRVKLFEGVGTYKSRDLKETEATLGGLPVGVKMDKAHITPRVGGLSASAIRKLEQEYGLKLQDNVEKVLHRVENGIVRESSKGNEKTNEKNIKSAKKNEASVIRKRSEESALALVKAEENYNKEQTVENKKQRTLARSANTKAKKEEVAYLANKKESATQKRNASRENRIAAQEESNARIATEIQSRAAKDLELERQSVVGKKSLVSRGLSKTKTIGKGMIGGKAGVIGSIAMLGASFLPGKAGEIGGQVAQVGFMAQMMGFSLKTLPGPLKSFGVALGLGIVGMKLLNFARERERKSIEGLGDVANLTSKKLNAINEIFGTNLSGSDKKLDFGNQQIAIGGPVRSAIDNLKGNKTFKDNFADDIRTLKKSSPSESNNILESLGISLSAKGLAPDMVKTLIYAIQEEAGRTAIDINFESFDLSKDKKGAINKSMKNAIKLFEKGFGAEKHFTPGSGGKISSPGFLVATDGAQKDMNTGLQILTNNIKANTEAFVNGQIPVEKMDKNFDSFFKNIKDMNSSGQIQLFQKILEKIGVTSKVLAASGGLVDDSSLRSLVLEGSLLGLIPTEEQFKAFSGKSSRKAYVAALTAYNKLIKDFKAGIKNGGGSETVNDIVAKQFGTDSSMSKTIQDIKTQIKAYRLLRVAQVDHATSAEIAGNAEMAAAVASGKNTAEIIKQVKAYQSLKKELELQQEAGLDAGDALVANLNRKHALISLQEKLISMKYSEEIDRETNSMSTLSYEYDLLERKIKSLEEGKILSNQRIIEDNNYLMEQLSAKEDVVNEKYDTQEQTLSNILRINQDITALQQSRVSLADALSRGDISAAAQSIVEIRGKNASSALGAQGDTLAVARKQELLAIGRVDKEKENKKLQLEILQIEHDKILPLKQQAEGVQRLMDIRKNAIADLEEQIRVEIVANNKLFLEQFKMTKLGIENALSALDLAKTAGVNVNSETFLRNVLDGSLGVVNAINSAIETATSDVVALLAQLEKIRSGKTADSLGQNPVVSASPDAVNDLINKMQEEINKVKAELAELRVLYNALLAKNGNSTVEGSAIIVGGEPSNSPCPDGMKMGLNDKCIPITTTPAVSSNRTTSFPANPRAAAIVAALTEQYKRGTLSPAYTGVTGSGGGGSMLYNALGGLVPKYFASGGFARGTDTVPAMLTPGEFIMRKNAVDKFGVQNLQNINNGASTSGAVYNYNLKVELNGSNLDVNDVASAVMGKIKQVESQRLRRR